MWEKKPALTWLWTLYLEMEPSGLRLSKRPIYSQQHLRGCRRNEFPCTISKKCSKFIRHGHSTCLIACVTHEGSTECGRGWFVIVFAWKDAFWFEYIVFRGCFRSVRRCVWSRADRICAQRTRKRLRGLLQYGFDWRICRRTLDTKAKEFILFRGEELCTDLLTPVEFGGNYLCLTATKDELEQPSNH